MRDGTGSGEKGGEVRIQRVFALGLIAAFVLTPFAAFAQSQHLTHLVVAFPPGGPVDMVARTMADAFGRSLGQRVIVENRPGANGAIGAEAVLRAPPDGTTLWFTSVGAVSINPALYPDLPYDVGRDFAPVSLVANNVEVLVVHPDNPARDLQARIVAARAGRPAVSMASSGVGSMPHLALEQLAQASGAPLLHVPYKGAAPAIADVMGGQVAAFFGDIPGVLNTIRAGRLRALGIAAERRHPLLPDVPTLAEQGFPGVDSNNWYALLAPRQTPQATIEALNAAVRSALASPAVRDPLLATGSEPAVSTPQELTDLISRDARKWGALIRSRGIHAQ